MSDLPRLRELRVRDTLRMEDWWAARLPQPSAADVIALKPGERPRLVQVKATQGAFDHFGPSDRHALLEEARAAGADCVLAWWPKGGKLKWIEPEHWPERQLRLEGVS